MPPLTERRTSIGERVRQDYATAPLGDGDQDYSREPSHKHTKAFQWKIMDSGANLPEPVTTETTERGEHTDEELNGMRKARRATPQATD